MGPRFEVWNHGGDPAGTVVIDPFAVVAVHEVVRSKAGREVEAAVIYLSGELEFTVLDIGRKVAAAIWVGKSIIIP